MVVSLEAPTAKTHTLTDPRILLLLLLLLLKVIFIINLVITSILITIIVMAIIINAKANYLRAWHTRAACTLTQSQSHFHPIKAQEVLTFLGLVNHSSYYSIRCGKALSQEREMSPGWFVRDASFPVSSLYQSLAVLLEDKHSEVHPSNPDPIPSVRLRGSSVQNHFMPLVI